MLYGVQKGDITRAGKVLADAFQHDPIWNKVFEGESDFEKRFRAFFESPVRYCLKYGEVYAPSENLEGVNEDGYLFFAGRKKDMIVSGGFNIYPLEVEEILYRLPYVADASVVGLPDPALEEIVCACIVLRKGAKKPSVEEIISYCKNELANYKAPKRVEFMDSLPTTPGTNKIRKLDLVEMLKDKNN